MQRKKWIINPKFQIGFILKVNLVFALVIFIFYAANLHFFRVYMQLGKKIGLPESHIFFVFIKDQFHQMNSIFIITSVSVFVGVCLLGALFSHRIAGPLYRLNKHFLEIANGKPVSEVHFRDTDYFQELAESYNKHLHSITENNRKL